MTGDADPDRRIAMIDALGTTGAAAAHLLLLAAVRQSGCLIVRTSMDGTGEPVIDQIAPSDFYCHLTIEELYGKSPVQDAAEAQQLFNGYEIDARWLDELDGITPLHIGMDLGRELSRRHERMVYEVYGFREATEVVHIDTPKPLSKRRARRLRAMRKANP